MNDLVITDLAQQITALVEEGYSSFFGKVIASTGIIKELKNKDIKM